jgi:GAF domain-containing protein
VNEGPATHEQFASIAAQLREGRTIEETYDLIVRTGPLVIDGCDRCAIGVLTDGRFKSAAASDDVMRLIDKQQNALREGPCLEASTEQVWQLDNDLNDGSKWPRLGAWVLENTPVRAMLAVPLVESGERGGALNVFADRPGAFTAESTGRVHSST